MPNLKIKPHLTFEYIWSILYIIHYKRCKAVIHATCLGLVLSRPPPIINLWTSHYVISYSSGWLGLYSLALCCLLPYFIFLCRDCKKAKGCDYVLPTAGCTMRRHASICGSVQLNIMLFSVCEHLWRDHQQDRTSSVWVPGSVTGISVCNAMQTSMGFCMGAQTLGTIIFVW